MSADSGHGVATDVAVLGAGSWGTALALVLARHGHSVRLWGHRGEAVRRMAATRRNDEYLTGFTLPPTVTPVAGLAEAVRDTEIVLVAVPSGAFRALLRRLAQHLQAPTPLVWATKGLDTDGGLLHRAAEELLPGHPLAVLSGPSFAGEAAAGLPTAVVVAASEPALGTRLARVFHGDAFRVYTSDDMIGVQLGGSVKNVLAIATGIADGLELGANARAGLITRGLAEIRRLGRAMGAGDDTFTGLAGAGDLILTCTDDQSRNRRYGLAIGRGAAPRDAEESIGQTVEGARTAAAVVSLADGYGVEMPICRQVYGIVVDGYDPELAARELMLRDPRPEAE